jgi:uncharacterized cupin superfamily protein
MDKKNSANEEGIFEPFPITEVPWEDYSPNPRFGMRYQHMSSYGGATQIGIANEILAPGKQANASHYHMLEEEHVFILEGELTCHLGDKSYIMSAGHYVCFPAGQKVGHALFNHTDKPCRYLVFGNPQPHDVAVCTESGRVMVKSLGVGFRESAVMSYWEGIDTGE